MESNQLTAEIISDKQKTLPFQRGSDSSKNNLFWKISLIIFTTIIVITFIFFLVQIIIGNESEGSQVNQVIFGDNNTLNNDLSTTNIYSEDESLIPKVTLKEVKIIPNGSDNLNKYFLIKGHYSFFSQISRFYSFQEVKVILMDENFGLEIANVTYSPGINSGTIQFIDSIEIYLEWAIYNKEDYDVESVSSKGNLKAKVYLKTNGKWIESNVVDVVLSK